MTRTGSVKRLPSKPNLSLADCRPLPKALTSVDFRHPWLRRHSCIHALRFARSHGSVDFPPPVSHIGMTHRMWGMSVEPWMAETDVLSVSPTAALRGSVGIPDLLSVSPTAALRGSVGIPDILSVSPTAALRGSIGIPDILSVSPFAHENGDRSK